MKNHLGSYECKLCLTLHNNEVSIVTGVSLIHFVSFKSALKVPIFQGSYLAHTQGKKHQANL